MLGTENWWERPLSVCALICGAIPLGHVLSPWQIWACLLSTTPGGASVYIKCPGDWQGPLRPRIALSKVVPFPCQQWEAASQPILQTEQSNQHLLPNCAHFIPSLEKLILESCNCRLHLFFVNNPWSWLWFWSYESSKGGTQICYTDREINTKKTLGLYEPATTRWITSCDIS